MVLTRQGRSGLEAGLATPSAHRLRTASRSATFGSDPARNLDLYGCALRMMDNRCYSGWCSKAGMLGRRLPMLMCLAHLPITASRSASTFWPAVNGYHGWLRSPRRDATSHVWGVTYGGLSDPGADTNGRRISDKHGVAFGIHGFSLRHSTDRPVVALSVCVWCLFYLGNWDRR